MSHKSSLILLPLSINIFIQEKTRKAMRINRTKRFTSALPVMSQIYFFLHAGKASNLLDTDNLVFVPTVVNVTVQKTDGEHIR